jgi:signal peptidase I
MSRSRERIVNGCLQAEARNLQALKCELAGEMLCSSGSLRLRVDGWSMLPVIWPGDTLVIDRVSARAVTEGDIVMFSRGQRLVAHRITKKCSPTMVQTQGDALPRPDSPVFGRDLWGKVSFIVRNGKLIEPSRRRSFSQRTASAVFRHSKVAAHVVAVVHGLRRRSQVEPSLVQTQ